MTRAIIEPGLAPSPGSKKSRSSAADLAGVSVVMILRILIIVRILMLLRLRDLDLSGERTEPFGRGVTDPGGRAEFGEVVAARADFVQAPGGVLASAGDQSL